MNVLKVLLITVAVAVLTSIITSWTITGVDYESEVVYDTTYINVQVDTITADAFNRVDYLVQMEYGNIVTVTGYNIFNVGDSVSLGTSTSDFYLTKDIKDGNANSIILAKK